MEELLGACIAEYNYTALIPIAHAHYLSECSAIRECMQPAIFIEQDSSDLRCCHGSAHLRQQARGQFADTLPFILTTCFDVHDTKAMPTLHSECLFLMQ